MQAVAMRQSRGDDPLYRRIVNDIRHRIASGEYAPGDQLFTLGEMCRAYGVSRITADRVLRELKGLQLIETFRGRGAFVKGLPRVTVEPRTAPISRIIVLWVGLPLVETGFAGAIWQGIARECATRRVRLSVEHVPYTLTEARSVPFAPAADHGIIVIGANLSVLEFSLLENPDLRSVLVDATCVGASCVVTDNYAGMAQLVDHLAGLGHRRVAMGFGFSNSYNSANENEREEAFLHLAAHRGLSPLLVESGDYEEALALLDGPNRPTAVLFPQDGPALAFLEMARKGGLRVPEDVSVAGFDDYPEAAAEQGLTTVRIAREEMGRAAVRSVLGPPPPYARRRWVRIPPELVVRYTTGPAVEEARSKKQEARSEKRP